MKKESHFPRAADEPHEVLEREVDGADIVHELNSPGQARELRSPSLLIHLDKVLPQYLEIFSTNLELIHSGEDECNGGNDDHGEADEGRDLRRPPRLRVLRHVPAEAPQPAKSVRAKVFLNSPLILCLLSRPLALRFLLANLQIKSWL